MNQHTGDPHYVPMPQTSLPIRRGDWVLIDLWAKEAEGTFGDITWVLGMFRPSNIRMARIDLPALEKLALAAIAPRRA